MAHILYKCFKFETFEHQDKSNDVLLVYEKAIISFCRQSIILWAKFVIIIQLPLIYESISMSCQ